ncbi:hypothetical protein [Hyphomicrobium sp. CS1GBMeth3]|uniref:hypothetical protein n=1 Tax=Hyphomicrobium sp. CS1GBMeth3 TaxID=1892845 RepID=UPI0009317AA3|nr:hypothetical protein [Hyphomicrobium sp. CS1GBMeth3]
MRFIRSILAVLLVASLAVTPVAATAAATVKDAPRAADQDHTQHGHMTGMPDCHGMVHLSEQSGHDDRRQHKLDPSEVCPDCDMHKSCSADVCQLKCFKVLGSLSERPRAADMQAERYVSAPPIASEPVSWKPRTPPPRT